MDTNAPVLVVSETSTSNWNYHLRRVHDGKLFLSGGAPPALCGKPLGWDTKIKLASWGTKSHIPEWWCPACAAEARRLGVPISSSTGS